MGANGIPELALGQYLNFKGEISSGAILMVPAEKESNPPTPQMLKIGDPNLPAYIIKYLGEQSRILTPMKIYSKDALKAKIHNPEN